MASLFAVAMTTGYLIVVAGSPLRAVERRAEPGALPAQQPAAATTPVWDGVYTKDQARRGKGIYTQDCGHCHGSDLRGGEVAGELAPELVGPIFLVRWSGPVAGLFSKIASDMPKDYPGTLKPDAVADVVSYLLEANDAQPASVELTSDLDKLKSILVTKKPPKI